MVDCLVDTEWIDCADVDVVVDAVAVAVGWDEGRKKGWKTRLLDDWCWQKTAGAVFPSLLPLPLRLPSAHRHHHVGEQKSRENK